jgi:hypothetical protein
MVSEPAYVVLEVGRQRPPGAIGAPVPVVSGRKDAFRKASSLFTQVSELPVE